MGNTAQRYILLISIIILSLVTISQAVDYNTNFNHVRSSASKGVIKKCCPDGQYVAKRVCTDYDEVGNFSSVNVYDKSMYDTGQLLRDVFTIVPAMFEEDPDFQKDSLNLNFMGFTIYVIEDGSLQLERPNMYHRWTLIDKGEYCIDYVLMNNTGTLKLMEAPKFWGIFPYEEEAEKSDEYLSCGLLVSCLFLLLVLLVYILLPELQNLCGLILMAYAASLLMAFLLLAIIQLFSHSDEACLRLTLGIYYFFLASFCWMTVMSYDIWWTFRGYAKARPIHRRGEFFKFLMYCLFAFGVPLLMTISLFVLDTVDMKSWPWFITPHVPDTGCFLEDEDKMLYLYTPLLILNVTNWMFYLMTAFNLWRLNRATAILDSAAAGTPAAHRSQRHRFMVYLKLAVVMGLNWLLEVVSFLKPGFKMWYVTDAYTVLIGFLIFLIFVCKKEIYRKLYKRYALRSTRRFYPGSTKSYSSSSTASDSNQETTTLQICSNPKGGHVYTGLMRKE